MLNTHVNTFFFFFYSGKRGLTDREQKLLNSNLYCNNADTFLYILRKIRDELMECQNQTL